VEGNLTISWCTSNNARNSNSIGKTNIDDLDWNFFDFTFIRRLVQDHACNRQRLDSWDKAIEAKKYIILSIIVNKFLAKLIESPRIYYLSLFSFPNNHSNGVMLATFSCLVIISDERNTKHA
jgi:hypothetical protein